MEVQHKKKERDKAKIRFKHAMQKLETRTEEEEASDTYINIALNGVNSSWEKLEEVQVEYTSLIEEGSQKQEINMITNLEKERDSMILKAEDVLARKENEKKPLRNEIQGQEEKEERNKAHTRFQEKMTTLKTRLEEKDPDITFIKAALEEVNNSWQELDDAQVEFMLMIDEISEKEEHDSHSILDSKREKIILEAEDALVRMENEKKIPKRLIQDDLTPKKEDNRGEKHKTKEISNMTGSYANPIQMASSALANIGTKISELLSKVPVSKKKQEAFEVKVEKQLIDYWDEDTQCKVYTGVLLEKWVEFITRFQYSVGITDKTRADFEQMAYADTGNDQIKAFTCKGKDLVGRYGMFALIKNDVTNKLDVAYAVYRFEAKFTGSNSKDEKGRFFSDETVFEDVFTGEGVKGKERFQMGDINSLSRDFIIGKALSAFTESGQIDRVNYVDSE